MGSIIGHRIDYNGVGALRGQRHLPRQKLTQVPPSPPGAPLHVQQVDNMLGSGPQKNPSIDRPYTMGSYFSHLQSSHLPDGCA